MPRTLHNIVGHAPEGDGMLIAFKLSSREYSTRARRRRLGWRACINIMSTAVYCCCSIQPSTPACFCLAQTADAWLEHAKNAANIAHHAQQLPSLQDVTPSRLMQRSWALVRKVIASLVRPPSRRRRLRDRPIVVDFSRCRRRCARLLIRFFRPHSLPFAS